MSGNNSWFQYCETLLGTDIQLSDTSDKLTTHLKSDVDVCLSILQAGTCRRFLINAVDVNGKVKLNGASTDILKS